VSETWTDITAIKGVARLMDALSDITGEPVELSTWRAGKEPRWRCQSSGLTYDGSTPLSCVRDAWSAWIAAQFRDEVQ